MLAVSTAASVIYMLVLVPAADVPDLDATYIYPALIFFWSFALLNLFGSWPPHRLSQPWRGFAGGILSWILSILTWKVLQAIMRPEDAGALIFYSLFTVFVLAWFSGGIVDSLALRQPTKGLLLALGSIAVGIAVYSLLGRVDQCWLYMTPMWLLYFFEEYPFGRGHSHVVRLTIWTGVLVGATWLLSYIHTRVGAPVSEALGSDVENLIFLGMIPVYAVELVQIRCRQPLKGALLSIVILTISAVAGVVYYYWLEAPEWWASRYVLVVWMWIVLVQWWPWPWPSRGDA